MSMLKELFHYQLRRDISTRPVNHILPIFSSLVNNSRHRMLGEGVMSRSVDFGGERAMFWRGKLREQAGSGLSVSAFCRREDFSPNSFYRWRRILAEGDGSTGSRRRPSEPAPEDVFAPVSVVGQAPTEASETSIELVLRSGRLIRVGPGFDSETLVRLVDILDSSSC